MESNSTRTLVIDGKLAAGFRSQVAAYEERIADYCARHSIAEIPADAAVDALTVLRRTLMEGGFVR